MKIIDNKKDYYDYLSGIYGIDELAVYDRRGSVTWAQYKDGFPLFVDTRRVKDDVFIPEKRKRWWRPHRRFLCVEAGKRQYLIMAERILAKESADEVEIRRSLLGSRLVEEKHSKAPLAVFECEMYWTPFDRKNDVDWTSLRYWDNRYCYFRQLGVREEPLVENPILAGSFIASMIAADEIWKALYEYLISLNDKKIVDNRPDTLKIEAAGFDLKTSFRNTKE
jgi:hypothetical protein